MSPLTEGRGLKLWAFEKRYNVESSPLTEGRGLKHGHAARRNAGLASPLTEGRGLKLNAMDDDTREAVVAPHGGAWIETKSVCGSWAIA